MFFRGLVCITDRNGARGIVPVASPNLDAVSTNIRAQEPEVQAGEAPALANDLRDLCDLLGDDRIEARCVVVVPTTNIASEVAKLDIELLDDARIPCFSISIEMTMVSKITYTV